MLSVERKDHILDYLKNNEFARLNDLAKELNTSESTVRRDLEYLQKRGLLERIHGGVRNLSGKEEAGNLTFFGEQINFNKEEKSKIADAAANLVKNGETIIIDVGTTAYYFAERLKNRDIQVVTNSLPVVNLLSDSKVDLIVVGGNLNSKVGIFLSAMTEEIFNKIHADKLFMGVGGIDEEIVTNSNMLLVGIQKIMMKISSEVILLADHTKFDRKALNYLADLTSIDNLVTDSKVPPRYKNLCREKGVNLIIS
jgi:DeoR/GlpR family transcriptional regulator of sugar metabolism